MDSHALDTVFSALSDPTRRGLLARLAEGEQNVVQLTAAFDISQPAISRHIRILDEAGLVRREKRGRETFVMAQTEAAQGAAAWLDHYVRFWSQHFDRMDDILSRQQEDRNDR